MAAGPNVLLVVLDAARRDYLEPYGAPAGSSPAIAQLASSGVAMPEVHATSCWTVPSHASFFTGLLPRAAGLAEARTPAACRPHLEGHRDRLLPEVMRRAGYSTTGVSTNLWLSEPSGFTLGFDRFAQIDSGRNGSIHLTSRRARARWLAEAARGKVDDGAREVEAALEPAFARSDGKPFFCFVNLLECHSPYLPPRPYGGVSTLERLRAAEDARRWYTLEAIWRACAGISRVPEDTLARMRRLYAASLRYMDDWLARLLERLDARGALDETVVVVVSDHGENFGEGGLIAHALSLDERLIHVPLVMSGPGVGDQAIHSLAALPRLLADVAGLQDHPWHDGPPEEIGVAQLDPPLVGMEPELVERARGVGLSDAIDLLSAPQTCACANGLKLMLRGDREEVYDLAEDPLELHPVPPSSVGEHRRADLERLRTALDHPAVTARQAADVSAPSRQASAEELSDLEDRMRLLGYM